MKIKTLYHPLGGVLAATMVVTGLVVPLAATAANPSATSVQLAQSGSGQAGKGGDGDHAADRDRSKDQDRDKDQDRMMDQDQLQDQIRTHLQTMDQLHDRIQQTQATEDREELMTQYRDQIRESVQLMEKAAPTAAGKDDAGMRQMEQNQQMMQQLIQHMWQYQELQS
ncbi:hypothetical protein [Marinobacter sp.]|uniref:Uncharacterized protein n=2 Tax=Marinobacter profundi TaxID=2666256 RepID=A0A2G1URI2_9GAMM|nr:hypothetical protein [Marinobacter sp.]MBD3656669.1 hypothetical protein [Marinobacter sp.]PHQ17106.1 hypothetical protein CLH61_00670 [Marinobacter profundi]